MIVEPIEDPNQFAEITQLGCEILEIVAVPESERDCFDVVDRLSAALSKVPHPAEQVDAELIKGRYLTAVGIVFAQVIANSFGWQFCEIRKRTDRREDAVDAVVSPDRSYFVYPIGVVYKEAHRHRGECRKVYEKIKIGSLPDASPGNFIEITA